MADSGIPATVDAVVTTSLANFSRVLTDNIFNGIPAWRRLRERGNVKRVNGGITHVEHALAGKSTAAGFYKGSESLDTTFQEGMNLREYEWQEAYASVSISRREEMQNRAEHQMVNLLSAKTQQAEMTLRDLLGQATVQSVAQAGELLSLADIVNTTSIAGGNESWWQSTVTASGSFAGQGLSDMRTLFNTVSASGMQDHPTVIITTQSVFEFYESTTQPQIRYGSTREADAGFINLLFKGQPVIWDQYVDSSVMYMLNEDYLFLVQDVDTDFVVTPFVKPSNQSAKVAQILWAGALATNNRRRHGKLTGITA